LSDRKWTCGECGAVHDRDLNAAKNLENWGVNSLLAASSAESINACGEDSYGLDLGLCETNLCEAGIRYEITISISSDERNGDDIVDVISGNSPGTLDRINTFIRNG
jgi:hypothetical protein